jgi:hypothetical protein
VVRGHAGEPTHVVVLHTLGAPQRMLLRGRRARPAPPGPPPEPVPTARATVIAAHASEGEGAAELWLRDADPEAEAAAALAVLNRLLHLHRVAAADPAVPEAARDQALAVRVGIGRGEEVVEGRWTEALTLPARPPRRRRDAALRPQERLAALLAGRDAPLACEGLALRARADLDAGRTREAALQLGVALAAALEELLPWAPRGDLGARIAELRELRPAAEAAAAAALQGGLDDAAVADVARGLGRLEAALRARTAVGLD